MTNDEWLRVAGKVHSSARDLCLRPDPSGTPWMSEEPYVVKILIYDKMSREMVFMFSVSCWN